MIWTPIMNYDLLIGILIYESHPESKERLCIQSSHLFCCSWSLASGVQRDVEKCLMLLYVGPCHMVSAELAVAMAVPIENPAEVLLFPANRWDLRLSCQRGKLSSGIVLLHDNARPYTARQTQTLLREQFHWGIFEHPPYSSDLAPSDFFLFPKMEHIADKRFTNDEDLKDTVGCHMVWREYTQTGVQRYDVCLNVKGDY